MKVHSTSPPPAPFIATKEVAVQHTLHITHEIVLLFIAGSRKASDSAPALPTQSTAYTPNNSRSLLAYIECLSLQSIPLSLRPCSPPVVNTKRSNHKEAFDLQPCTHDWGETRLVYRKALHEILHHFKLSKVRQYSPSLTSSR